MGTKKYKKTANRVTLNLDNYINEIIEKLKDTPMSKTKTGVIYKIIDKWIKNNSKNLLNTYDINIKKIQSNYYPELNEKTNENNLTNDKNRFIKSFKKLSKGFYRIKIEDLVVLLDIPKNNVIKSFFNYYDEITEDFKLFLDGNIIINRSNE